MRFTPDMLSEPELALHRKTRKVVKTGRAYKPYKPYKSANIRIVGTVRPVSPSELKAKVVSLMVATPPRHAHGA